MISMPLGEYSAINPTVNDMFALTEDEVQFLELVLVALGYDIKFEDFRNMSQEERKSLIRDIRINKVLDGHK